MISINRTDDCDLSICITFNSSAEYLNEQDAAILYHKLGEILQATAWIDVRDKLPANSSPVLVYNRKYSKPLGIGYYNHGGDWGFNDAGWTTKCMSGHTVTHWMPVFQPPEAHQ